MPTLVPRYRSFVANATATKIANAAKIASRRESGLTPSGDARSSLTLRRLPDACDGKPV
ncbi:MAG: hypothetical protein PUP92_17660 [Rhizonema sp. PD38]|nr:hypothetical protein [Rhizonema sp. PD38]